LGYGGLSAHIGVVILASTMPVWYQFDFWRFVVGAGGLTTGIFSSLVAQTRADRKGQLAYATSGTLGLFYTILSFGYADLALSMCLGHAALRMSQIVRSPNIIQDTYELRSALGGRTPMWPVAPPAWAYKVAWTCRRLDADLNLIHMMDIFMTDAKKPLDLSRFQQWLATGVIGLAMCAPFTPTDHAYEHTMLDWVSTQPHLAALLGGTQFAVSVVGLQFLFNRVLHPNRFKRASTVDVEEDLASKLEMVDFRPLAICVCGSLITTSLVMYHRQKHDAQAAH